MAQFYDVHQHNTLKYNVSNKVWLSSENIRTTHLTKKLDYKWLGPYDIEWVISHNAYQLKLPTSFGQVHPVFSITLLCPFESDPITECHKCHLPPPPPIVCNGVEEYEVEKILDSQIFRGKVKYLICWKGYGVEVGTPQLDL